MAEKGFVRILREIVMAGYSEERGIEIRNNRVGRHNLSQYAVETLEELLKLVLETRYFPSDVKEYLKGQSIQNISMRKNENIATTKSRIYYQIGRLKQEMGEDALYELITTKEEETIKRYGEKVRKLRKKWETKSLLDNMTIRVPAYDGREIKELEKDELEFMYMIINQYSKKGIQKAEKLFTQDMVAYVHYLEKQDREGVLTEQEKEALKKLLKVLGE